MKYKPPQQIFFSERKDGESDLNSSLTSNTVDFSKSKKGSDYLPSTDILMPYLFLFYFGFIFLGVVIALCRKVFDVFKTR